MRGFFPVLKGQVSATSPTDEAVAVIVATPERWRIVEPDVRRFLIPRFPYAIYYRAYSDHVRILAFEHHSRHPEYWRERISN